VTIDAIKRINVINSSPSEQCRVRLQDVLLDLHRAVRIWYATSSNTSFMIFLLLGKALRAGAAAALRSMASTVLSGVRILIRMRKDCSSKAPDRVLIPTVYPMRAWREAFIWFCRRSPVKLPYARLAGHRRKCGERAVEVGRCDRDPSESSSVFRTAHRPHVRSVLNHYIHTIHRYIDG
jgi:hypothetical protein